MTRDIKQMENDKFEWCDSEIKDFLNLNDVSLILNMACGKTPPQVNLNFPYYLLNVDKDTMVSDDIEEVIKIVDLTVNERVDQYAYCYNYLRYDAYEFLQKFPFQFDLVCIYRFLEHISKANILYFIYLLSTAVKEGGLIDVIVPDYTTLASKLLKQESGEIDGKEFEQEDIITTFEMLNEPYDPHASIWTPKRADHYIEYEKRFKIINMQQNYIFDGRDVYIRFLAQRVNPLSFTT